jgi:H/ACA ribonucleoprotein complex subunit 1
MRPPRGGGGFRGRSGDRGGRFGGGGGRFGGRGGGGRFGGGGGFRDEGPPAEVVGAWFLPVLVKYQKPFVLPSL